MLSDKVSVVAIREIPTISVTGAKGLYICYSLHGCVLWMLRFAVDAAPRSFEGEDNRIYELFSS